MIFHLKLNFLNMATCETKLLVQSPPPLKQRIFDSSPPQINFGPAFRRTFTGILVDSGIEAKDISFREDQGSILVRVFTLNGGSAKHQEEIRSVRAAIAATYRGYSVAEV